MVISLVSIWYNINYYNLFIGREIWIGRDGNDSINGVKATFIVSPFPLTVFDFALTSPIDTNDSEGDIYTLWSISNKIIIKTYSHGFIIS